MDSLSLMAFTVANLGKDLSLKTASVLHILAEGGDIVDGRIIDFIQECSLSGTDVERQDSVFLMPIRASLLTACPAEVLPGVLMCAVGQARV